MNNSIKSINSNEVKIQLNRAEFQKKILIKKIYKEYEIYLKIVRKSIFAYVKKGIFAIYANFCDCDSEKALNSEELVNFLKQNIRFLINSKLPLLTIEQLKLGDISFPHKHLLNEKVLNELIEFKEHQKFYFEYVNELINEKPFDFHCNNSSASYEYYELLNEEEFLSVNFDEKDSLNSFSKQNNVKNDEYILDAVLEIIEEEKPNKLTYHENLNELLNDFFISSENLNFFETIDKAFTNFLLNLSYEINSELFKVNLINKTITEDAFKCLSNNNIIKYPHPFVIRYDLNLNKFSEYINKFSDIYLFNISNIELEFYNLDLSICRNKINELKQRFRLLNKKQIYWKDKELKLNNLN